MQSLYFHALVQSTVSTYSACAIVFKASNNKSISAFSGNDFLEKITWQHFFKIVSRKDVKFRPSSRFWIEIVIDASYSANHTALSPWINFTRCIQVTQHNLLINFASLMSHWHRQSFCMNECYAREFGWYS